MTTPGKSSPQEKKSSLHWKRLTLKLPRWSNDLSVFSPRKEQMKGQCFVVFLLRLSFLSAHTKFPYSHISRDIQEEEDLSQMDDVTRISKENTLKATSVTKSISKILGDFAPKDPHRPLFRRPEQVPGFFENQKRHDVVRPYLTSKFSNKKVRLAERKKELVAIYKAHAEKWKIKAKRYERKKEKLTSAKPKPPAVPEARNPPAGLPDKKPSSRSRNRYGDAVRSEEEMQRIMMELLEEER